MPKAQQIILGTTLQCPQDNLFVDDNYLMRSETNVIFAANRKVIETRERTCEAQGYSALIVVTNEYNEIQAASFRSSKLASRFYPIVLDIPTISKSGCERRRDR